MLTDASTSGLTEVYPQAHREPSPSALGDYLTDHSPKDRPWDVHRSQADKVAVTYAQETEFQRLSARMFACSGLLLFTRQVDQDGVFSLRLRGAQFCRVRHCPVCQWRRSMMWQAKFYQALPTLQDTFPRARWVFLTLTVKNCPLVDLRQTLKAMSDAWGRLVKRPEFKPVLGWVRTTEVTRGSDGSAHPHFHCLLMVKPSYFTGRSYVKQDRWTELWQQCAKLDYKPIVDVRAVKGALSDAVKETLKYAVKPSDLEANGEWLLELTHQVHKLRFIASGGALKAVFKPEGEISNQDMIEAEIEPQAEIEASTENCLAFSWDKPAKRYRRTQ